MQAREVIIATNGYTTGLTPALRRRVIPIGSYIIATEPLAPGLARRLIPNNRVVSDTRNVIFYYRLSEDGQRMLFGGRVIARETDSLVSALPLHRQMTKVFPELAATKISRSWGGFIAYTFDALPHLGRQADGLHYCMGYCGSGVSLAPYFGTRLAQQLLGKPEGRTALDDLKFQTRPLYSGDPWFLSLAIAYYRLRDRLPF
jgi:glycine/D-amino acid oxidase-like deaminating enzyme